MITRMHRDEFAIEAALVRRLLATQFPPWAALPVRPVASAGTDHALFRIGDEFVARLPRVAWAIGQGERELRWLPVLAPHLPLAVPEPITLGQPAEGYPWTWSIHRWLPGENAITAPVLDETHAALDLAQFIAALHRIDPTGAPAAGRSAPLAARDARVRTAIGTLGDAIDAAAVTAAWENALAAPAWPRAPGWIHGDLHAGNLLTPHGRLSAVIDFGGAGLGDPAVDAMAAWLFLAAPTRDLFRAALAVDDATWTRARGWALSFGLIALPYYRDSNPALAGIARRAIVQVLADSRVH